MLGLIIDTWSIQLNMSPVGSILAAPHLHSHYMSWTAEAGQGNHPHLSLKCTSLHHQQMGLDTVGMRFRPT